MMKRFAAALCALLIVLSFPLFAFAATYGTADSARLSVARILVYGTQKVYDRNDKLVETTPGLCLGHGSCFAVGKKGRSVSYFVTNRHVISTKKEYQTDGTYTYELIPTDFYLVMDDEVTLHDIEIITDNAGGPDLAIVKLKTPTDDRQPIYLRPYKDAEALRNTEVYTVGFPGSASAFSNESHTYASGTDSVSIRKGIIDHELDEDHSDGYGTLLLVDAPISGGNSGGPLVDSKGCVLGVNTYGAATDANMNAAVSVNEVVTLLDKFDVPYMKSTGIPQDMLIYGVLAAAIVGVVVVLIIVLRKPKSAPAPSPIPSPSPAAQQTPVDFMPPTQNDTMPQPGMFKPAQDMGPTYRQPQQQGMPQRVLVAVDGPLKDKRYPIAPHQTLYIGRDTTKCKVAFPNGTPGVSNMHCSISFDGRTATITDLKSSYGTYVDKKKLAPNAPVTLHRGLAVDIGSEKNRFTLQ